MAISDMAISRERDRPHSRLAACSPATLGKGESVSESKGEVAESPLGLFVSSNLARIRLRIGPFG